MHDYYSNRRQKIALTKYMNMKPDWPLRSLIIYLKLGPTMGNLISVSAVLKSGIPFKKI